MLLKKRVLVCGDRGLLGGLWCTERDGIDHVIRASHIGISGIQVSSKPDPVDWIRRAIERNTIDIIVNCCGLTDVEQCERDNELAELLNISFPQILAMAARSSGCRLVHISTDHLFNKLIGERMMTEEDVVCPVNYYAKTKYKGELAVLENYPQKSLVVRTNFLGRSVSQKPSYTDWLISRLRRREEVFVAYDVYFNPIHYASLINGVESLLLNDCSGVFNIASDDYSSKYQFACQLESMMYGSMEESIIRPICLDETNMRRPRNMILSNQKFRSVTGGELGALSDQLSILANDYS